MNYIPLEYRWDKDDSAVHDETQITLHSRSHSLFVDFLLVLFWKSSLCIAFPALHKRCFYKEERCLLGYYVVWLL
jgi:hypothetical protein